MPVTHVVLIEWTEQASEEHRERAREIARGFSDRIPGILSLTEGPSISTEGLEGPYNYAMVITFADQEALEGYLPHPEHKEFTALLDGTVGSVTVYDLLS